MTGAEVENDAFFFFISALVTRSRLCVGSGGRLLRRAYGAVEINEAGDTQPSSPLGGEGLMGLWRGRRLPPPRLSRFHCFERGGSRLSLSQTGVNQCGSAGITVRCDPGSGGRVQRVPTTSCVPATGCNGQARRWYRPKRATPHFHDRLAHRAAERTRLSRE